jgi:hypothetical protein
MHGFYKKKIQEICSRSNIRLWKFFMQFQMTISLSYCHELLWYSEAVEVRVMPTYARSIHAGNGRYLSACMGFIKKNPRNLFQVQYLARKKCPCNFKWSYLSHIATNTSDTLWGSRLRECQHMAGVYMRETEDV